MDLWIFCEIIGSLVWESKDEGDRKIIKTIKKIRPPLMKKEEDESILLGIKVRLKTKDQCKALNPKYTHFETWK